MEIDGLQDLLKDMDELPLVVSRRLIARALRAGAEPIQAMMEQLAPDDPDTPGSRVKQNIKTTITEQTAAGAIALIGPTKKGFVAGFAEFGTAHQPARPFIGPAFDATVNKAVDIIGEVLGDGIEKALKKQNRQRAK